MSRTFSVNGIHVTVVPTPDDTGPVAAKRIIDLVTKKPDAFMAIATGVSPKPMFRSLIEDHLKNGTSYNQAVATSLDEWVAYDSPYSARSKIDGELFKHLNLKERHYLPQPPYAQDAGAKFEQFVQVKGNYDLVVLGVGANGHIAFNEPGTAFDTLTHIVALAPETREKHRDKFGGIDKVPRFAATLGVKTILNARSIMLIAFGEEKAEAIQHLLSGKQSPKWVCTALQSHRDVHLVLDEAVTSKLPKNYAN